MMALATRTDNPQALAVPALDALVRRADGIVKARPAYAQIIEFYLEVFRRQIECAPRIRIRAQEVAPQQALASLDRGSPLAASFDPGLDPASLASLWAEMKDVFRHGTQVLSSVVEKLDDAEKAHELDAGPWLATLRADSPAPVARVARQVGVDAGVLGTLARAVTLPHWRAVADAWLPQDYVAHWKWFKCPVCGGTPALGELRTEPESVPSDMKPAATRYMHCGFCGTRWAAPRLQCPACDSTLGGDAKYFFSPDEPLVRIDYCASCKHYLKVVDGDLIRDPVHAGIELVASVHVDLVGNDKGLTLLGTETRLPQQRKRRLQ